MRTAVNGDLAKQVRTPPVRQRTGWWGVYMSLSSRRNPGLGAEGKIKSADAVEIHR